MAWVGLGVFGDGDRRVLRYSTEFLRIVLWIEEKQIFFFNIALIRHHLNIHCFRISLNYT